ncbi:MAG: DUF3194 domain-containing protein [Ignisphaera sp.]
MRKVKPLNLDLNKIDFNVLSELANIIENTIINYLNTVLGTRATDYGIAISVKLDDTLTISIDVDAKAYFISKPSLEAIIDTAVSKAFDAAEQFLSRFRCYEENDRECKESCHSNSR